MVEHGRVKQTTCMWVRSAHSRHPSFNRTTIFDTDDGERRVDDVASVWARYEYQQYATRRPRRGARGGRMVGAFVTFSCVAVPSETRVAVALGTRLQYAPQHGPFSTCGCAHARREPSYTETTHDRHTRRVRVRDTHMRRA